MKILFVEQLLPLLNHTDVRTVVKWCTEHGVEIFGKGRGAYVVEVNFFEARERPIICSLKRRYHENWEHAYKLYSEGNIVELHKMNSNNNKQTSSHQKNKTSPLEEKYKLEFIQHAKSKAA